MSSHSSEFVDQPPSPQALQADQELSETDAHFFRLGLCHLLSGDRDSAYTTWQNLIDSQPDFDRVEVVTLDLSDFLDREALSHEKNGEIHQALEIRHCLSEINPYHLANLLSIILLCLQQGQFVQDKIAELGIFSLLESDQFLPLDDLRIKDFLTTVLENYLQNKNVIYLTEQVCRFHPQHKSVISTTLKTTIEKLSKNADKIIAIGSLGRELDPDDMGFYIHISIAYKHKGDFNQSIQVARQLCDRAQAQNAVYKAIALSFLERQLEVELIFWDERARLNREVKNHLSSLTKEDCKALTSYDAAFSLMTVGFSMPYFDDLPRETHTILANVRELATQRILTANSEVATAYRKRLLIRKQNHIDGRPLRIGYFSQCLCRHPVGTLARWLIHHHDRSQFHLYGYIGTKHSSDDLLEWYKKQFFKVNTDILAGTKLEPIIDDGIDILIDPDSITAQHIGSLTFKPAPVQVTWLGWDANNMKSVDYFIADPYILPEDAQEYYVEKIWRMPQTFLAIDGFELGIPTIRRDTLGIPENAVVYLSAQNLAKRHPRNIWCQLQIIKQVPNSYLVLKSVNVDQKAMQNYFYKLADEHGIERDRLKFLVTTSTQEEHRANMRIADIILDTYPYSGATHTMEALWAELPIVTQVGEQFSARNSYSMMINAGISEGIAWNDAEYIEWGIKLGIDPELRHQVITKLRQSKHTAPLWNARQFARDIENAYRQMMEVYLHSEETDLTVDLENDRELFIAEAKIKNEDAVWFAQKGEIDKAILCWQTALEWHPDYVEANYNFATFYSNQREYQQALKYYQKAISIDPNYVEAIYNLGLILVRLNRIEEGLTTLHRALEISPNDIDIHLAIGGANFKQKQLQPSLEAYEAALKIAPMSSSALVGMSAVLLEMGKVDQAIECLEQVLAIEPTNAHVYCNLGYASMLKERMDEAVSLYSKALELDPTFSDAYWHFNSYIVSFIDHPLHFNFPLRRKVGDDFLNACYSLDPVRASLVYLTNYIASGMSSSVYHKLEELENFIHTNSSALAIFDVELIYSNFLFLLSSTRDNLERNCKMYRLAGELFTSTIIPLIERRSDWHSVDRKLSESKSKESLTIGIISPNFRRNSVGWCSLATICELAKITDLYLYNTGLSKPDNLSQEFEKSAKKVYWYEEELKIPEMSSYDARLNRISNDIINDNVDVLIDLDSITHPFNLHLLSRNLAPVCVSWLGYEAPFISAQNYWLGDQYTHPESVDALYVEKIIRLPNAHMAVAGFEALPVDRNDKRRELGIGTEDIVYLLATPGRKFNRALANAAVQIISQVPNAYLLYKGIADIQAVSDIFLGECEKVGLNHERVKFLPVTKTEKEHRSVYLLADISLDSYPYNGGTHNLEALWFDLPLVTFKGEQSFSRMGYSFLQALGIAEGIADNWEQYVEWGIRYGTDSDLRTSVKLKLIKGKDKDSLAPLWNPQKLARDIYNQLQALVNGR